MVIVKLKDLETMVQENPNRTVLLEVPLGELAVNRSPAHGLITAMLFQKATIKPIVSSDRFSAHGIEGKLSVEVPVRVALAWASKIGRHFRWQVRTVRRAKGDAIETA